MKGPLLVLSFFLCVATATASQPSTTKPLNPLQNAAAGTVWDDDDGGKVQILPVQPKIEGKLVAHDGPVVVAPVVEAIFASNFTPAQRNAIITCLSSFSTSQEFRKLSRYGVHTDSPQIFQADLSLGQNTSVTDLMIQHQLLAHLEQPLTRRPQPGSIFLIFLGPDVVSTLGNGISGKDFAAYHNDIHTEQGSIRYAVIPFSSNLNQWLSHTTAALQQTILNPDGNGWYAEQPAK